jgi:adenylate cyclase
MSTSSDDAEKLLGELVPQGGGDAIPLLKDRLMVGRRETCDVVLRFGNVSSNHCELTLESGYWFVRDLGSRNGTRLNGYRITKKRMDPGDTLSIAKRDYKAKYTPSELGAEGPPPDVDVMSEIMSQSLLEGAGLARQERQQSDGRVGLKNSADADDAADDDDIVLDVGSITDETTDADPSPGAPDEVSEQTDAGDVEPDEYNLAPE